MAVLNPPIDKINKGQPVCQFPRESFNRIAEILGHLKASHGLRLARRGPGGNHWTISIDEAWLYCFLTAYVSPMIDSAQQETEENFGGEPLPFDLAVRGGYPCIYVPQNGENLVYVRGIGSDAVRDSSATPTPDQDGWRQLPSGTGPVWVWTRWDHTTTGYLWGLSDTDPMQGTDARDRYLLSLLIGGFDGNDTEVTAQYYHGDIVCADDNGDDLSIDRDGYNDALCLHAFQVGAHSSEAWGDVDFVIREERSGDYPNAPYKVNYMSGANLKQEINTYVSNVIQQTIQSAIQHAITDLLTELINALGGSGQTVADLVDSLDAKYQPICTSSTPAWGIGQGLWTTTPPSS